MNVEGTYIGYQIIKVHVISNIGLKRKRNY